MMPFLFTFENWEVFLLHPVFRSLPVHGREIQRNTKQEKG
jgi:hypothetical protein